MDVLQCFEFLALLFVMRRLCAGVLLRYHLPANILHIFLMILLELLIDLALDTVLKIAPCEDSRDLLRHARDDFRQLCLGRRGREQRVLLQNTHEGEHPFTAVIRTHQGHRVHLARLDDKALRSHSVREHAKDRGNLRIDARLRGECRRCALLLAVPSE